MLRAFVSILALLALSTPVRAADTSALCAGWIGEWDTTVDIERDAAGKWAPTTYPRRWRATATEGGRCGFWISGSAKPDFELLISNDSYDGYEWENGKLTGPTRSRFERKDIHDARSWSVVTVGPRRHGSGFVRFDMTMADDQFIIVSSRADSEAGPFTLASYTTHQRRR